VKKSFNRANIILPRITRFQQQVKKQAEEKNLAENPERLKQSMDRGAFLDQKNISPGSVARFETTKALNRGSPRIFTDKQIRENLWKSAVKFFRP